MSKLNKKEETRKFLTYAVIGLTNSIIEAGSYAILLLWINQVAAQPISYALMVINSYSWNRKLTFHDTDRFLSVKLLKFVGVALVVLSLGTVFMDVLANVAGLRDVAWKAALAKMFTMTFSSICDYVGIRVFVFNDKSIFKRKNKKSISGS